MSFFDPTPEEQARDQRTKELQAKDYSHITIPREVQDAYRNIAAAESKLAHLRKYSRLNPAMKYEQRQASELKSDSETIIRRFFLTARTD